MVDADTKPSFIERGTGGQFGERNLSVIHEDIEPFKGSIGLLTKRLTSAA